MQAKVCDRTVQPGVYRTLSKTSDKWLSRTHSILLQIDRLQLTAVYCNRREVWRQHLKRPVFAMWNMQEFGIQIELTMTGHNRTTTSRRKELFTWYCVCVVKWSWRMKPSCWTLRRPTPMTTWKPRSRETTRSTTWNSTVTWTRERARSVAVFVVLVLCCHTHLLHTSHFVSRLKDGHRHACMSWAFSLTSLTSSPSSPSSSHSSLSWSSSFYPSTLRG